MEIENVRIRFESSKRYEFNESGQHYEKLVFKTLFLMKKKKTKIK